MGQPDDGRRFWLVLLRLNPSDSESARCRYDRAQPSPPPAAQAASGQSTEVQGLLDKLKENPKDVDSMARLGRILLFQQLHTEAKMVTERALQIQPDHIPTQINQAMVTAGQGDASSAFTQLEAILKGILKKATMPGFSRAC